jgi:hypothetical protein
MSLRVVASHQADSHLSSLALVEKQDFQKQELLLAFYVGWPAKDSAAQLDSQNPAAEQALTIAGLVPSVPWKLLCQNHITLQLSTLRNRF